MPDNSALVHRAPIISLAANLTYRRCILQRRFLEMAVCFPTGPTRRTSLPLGVLCRTFSRAKKPADLPVQLPIKFKGTSNNDEFFVGLIAGAVGRSFSLLICRE